VQSSLWLSLLTNQIPAIKALESILPPKKMEMSPRPAVIDEAEFEESDIVDFGEGEDDWEDEVDDVIDVGEEPECRQQ